MWIDRIFMVSAVFGGVLFLLRLVLFFLGGGGGAETEVGTGEIDVGHIEVGHVEVGHVEAGLRAFDKHNPFPEEFSRRITDMTASFMNGSGLW